MNIKTVSIILESSQKEYLHKQILVSLATRTLQIQTGFYETLVLQVLWLQMKPTAAMELIVAIK